MEDEKECEKTKSEKPDNGKNLSATIRHAAFLLTNGEPGKGESALAPDLAKFVLDNADSVILYARGMDVLGRCQFAQGKKAECSKTLLSGVNAIKKFVGASEPALARNLSITNVHIGLLQNLCFACTEQNLFMAAINAGKEAVRLARKYFGRDSRTLASALFGLSAAYYRNGKYREAAMLVGNAKTVWEKNGDWRQVGQCLNNLGRIYEEAGQLEDGVLAHMQAVALRRSLPDELDLAFSLGNLGVALATLKQWEDAIASLEESEELYDKNGMINSNDCRAFSRNLRICRKAAQEQAAASTGQDG